MTKIQRLINKCEQQGFTFLSLSNHDNVFTITIHNAKEAGAKPVLDYSRDKLDYELALSGWYKRGSVILAVGNDVNDTINSALETLDN